MDFSDNPQTQLIRESMRALAAKFPPAYWRDRDANHEFPTAYWRELGRSGWLGALVPEEYGGAGLGALEMAIIVEEIVAGGVGGTGGILLISNLCFGTMSILHHGNEAQRRKYLPMMSDGESVFAGAFTEPDSGSNFLKTRTHATRDGDGDGWRLNGAKVFITNIQRAPVALVLCRTTPLDQITAKTAGLSNFLLDDPAQTPGVRITAIDKLGLNALQTNQVFFDNVALPASSLLGKEGEGWSQILAVLNPERIVTTSVAVGLGNLAIDTAVRYATDRKPFGRPIGGNQSLSFPMAEAKAQLEAARVLNYKAAWLFDKGLPCGPEVNMAKYVATEACWHACDAAVQVHGGYGYTREYDVERYFREARLMRIAPITTQMALNFIAERVLGLPRSY
jgi:acyl-CoA dehydrogenase